MSNSNGILVGINGILEIKIYSPAVLPINFFAKKFCSLLQTEFNYHKYYTSKQILRIFSPEK